MQEYWINDFPGFDINICEKTAHQQCGFQKRLVTIGAHPDCDFCLHEPSISRQHAKIELDENGYRLVDLGSKNGTFIGDLRINDIYLTTPMTFRCGTVEISFEMLPAIQKRLITALIM